MGVKVDGGRPLPPVEILPRVLMEVTPVRLSYSWTWSFQDNKFT